MRLLPHVILGSLLCCGIVGPARGDDSPFFLKDGDTVVFYGDSITEQRLYTTFTEIYVVTRFPNLKMNFIHSGWGGDSVGGGGGGPIDERLQRDVFVYQPTVVTIMLGMNDGGYRAFDQGISDRYQQGYRHIIDQLKSHLPDVRLTLIQPSPYDDITRPVGFPGGYNSVLKTYGEFVKDLAGKSGATTVDFNSPVDNMLMKANQINPALAPQLVPDRVHPSPGGHLVMAETLLKGWNAPAIVSDVEVDAAGQKVARAENTQIDDFKGGDTVSWTETDRALPMPIEPSEDDPTRPLVDLALKSCDFTDSLNQELLRVTGLKAPYYELDIDDDTVGVFSRDDLAKGINLATQSTPMMDQAIEVKQLTVQHNDEHFMRWRNIQIPLEGKNNPAINQSLPPILEALDEEEKATVQQQRAKAQPIAHRYVLTPRDTAGEPPGTIPPDPVLPSGLGPNLALHKSFVSSNPNGGWNGLTDGSWTPGDPTTYATDPSPSFPKTVTIDLGKTESIGYVLLGVPPYGATKTIVVSLSIDNQTFTKIGGFSFPQDAAVKHLYSCQPTDARYIRLTYPNHYPTSKQYGPNYVFTSEVEAYAPVLK